jgi:hypothetical protein
MVKCQKCNSFFEKREILVTLEGFYCENCLPEGVSKRIIRFDFSWTGVVALMDYIDGDANLDQILIVEKIKEKMGREVMRIIQDVIKSYGGEVQQSDPESLGKGDASD